MKLRRALAAAAATAVIAPAALLSAGTAWAADGSETDTPLSTQEERDQIENDKNEDGAGDETETGANEDIDDEAEEEAEEDEDGTGDEDAAGDEDGKDVEEDGKDVEEGLTEGGNPPVETPCEDDNSLETVLNGLPEALVAGSGWHQFSLTLTNRSGQDLDRVYPYVITEAFSLDIDDVEADWDESYLGLIEIQYKDRGDWKSIPHTEENLSGYFGYLSLADGADATVELRMQIDAGSPDGWAWTLGLGEYWTEEGVSCAGGWDAYWIQVLAAESEVEPGAAAPQGERKPVDVKPSGAEGALAETGAGSALPMFALAGAAAVALGAGGMFAVRRRTHGADGGATA
ncbi:LPXTG cell wall anchor domain-containing protein [Streptomyces sp. ACA25]|uniref:LPXTG cell wall anchor domain-containing protein n=1 Tax=Streptomyces sp. ACA25 TaxID=3022596 RepID=UPI002307D074|nr:LPXTG cell wall anchor domain-containing protein [Streptomyces sp. ACA25]MDB1087396.1 LPXTG cell wall anchor domain-containing protein [Streptomyces sp. ACA25]